MAGGGEGFLVGGDRGGVFAAQGAGGGVLAAERGGLAGAGQLGGGEPGPGFGDDQPRGAGAQDRAGGAVPGAGDRRLVLPERGLRRAPPGEYVSRTWSAGAAWWSRRVVITVQVSVDSWQGKWTFGEEGFADELFEDGGDCFAWRWLAKGRVLLGLQGLLHVVGLLQRKKYQISGLKFEMAVLVWGVARVSGRGYRFTA